MRRSCSSTASRRAGAARQAASRFRKNLALDQAATASSDEAATQSRASHAVDGSNDTRWTASDGTKQQWWQVDLGQTQPIRSILINFEKSPDNYQYKVSTSNDGQEWQQIVTKNDWSGDAAVAVHDVDASGRYVRIDFTNLSPRTYASICEMGVYSHEVTPDSFFQDRYRMRWSNVIYQPGELKVVSYKNGKPWAESMFESYSPYYTGYQMPQVNGAALMLTFSDKDARHRTIFQIMDAIQKEALATIPGIRRLQIKEMGSDVMATAAAPIHLNIYGPTCANWTGSAVRRWPWRSACRR